MSQRLTDAAVDYYGVLHVQADAPLEIIRSSYRTLMQRLKHHPDLGGDHATAALINEAYAVLANAEKRAEYDRLRAAGGSRPIDAQCTAVLPQCAFCGTAYLLEREPLHDDRCSRCAAPLFPAVRHRLEPSGQRMLSRIRKDSPVAIATRSPPAERLPAVMHDLSLNGMQVLAKRPLEEASLVRVDGDFGDAVSRVAYCRKHGDTGWAIGLEFVTLRFAQRTGNLVSTAV